MLINENKATTQCNTVVKLLKAPHNNKPEKILASLAADTKLQDDTLNLLRNAIGENNLDHQSILALSEQEVIDFWAYLQKTFSTNQNVNLITAHAMMSSPNGKLNEYAPLFLLAIQQGINIYDIGPEVGQILMESEFKFDYQLLFLEQVLKDWDQYPEDAVEEINELLGEYAFEGDKIKLIQQKIEQYQN